MAAFNERVDSAENRGAIERKAAGELRRSADDIARKADGPKRDDIENKITELRDKIDEYRRTGEIDSDGVADALRSAIDDIEAAVEG